MNCREIGEQACGTAWCVCTFDKEEEMSAGREHAERRAAQAAAARKPRLKSKHDYDWKKEQEQ